MSRPSVVKNGAERPMQASEGAPPARAVPPAQLHLAREEQQPIPPA